MGKAKQKDIFSVLGHGLLDTRKCRALLACNERLAEASLCKCSSGGLCTHSGTQQKARYYPGENCGAGRRSASYRAICPTVSCWLGCMGQRSRLLHSVPITEVKRNGLCQRPEGLNQSKNQGAVQPHETTAHLLRKRRAHRRTAFLLAQGQHRHQPRRHGNDGGDDPGYAVRHV